MPNVLITGANRGLGLEHARQYAACGWTVHACVRQSSRADRLNTLSADCPGQVYVHTVDVSNHAAVDSLAGDLAGVPLEVLLNNAGTFGPAGAPEGMAYQSLSGMDYAIWREILEVNLLAPFKVATAFSNNLRASPRGLLVMMSSGLASITHAAGHSYAYRSSKAGLNMVTRCMAAEWPELIVVAMAPGWCRTALGGADAPLDPADSVRDQQQCFERLGLSDSGRYLDQYGQTVPW